MWQGVVIERRGKRKTGKQGSKRGYEDARQGGSELTSAKYTASQTAAANTNQNFHSRSLLLSLQDSPSSSFEAPHASTRVPVLLDILRAVAPAENFSPLIAILLPPSHSLLPPPGKLRSLHLGIPLPSSRSNRPLAIAFYRTLTLLEALSSLSTSFSIPYSVARR
ncbi:uncharacterized protein N7482_008149 [Penicillium canariense]|uniref:Uncharacterized protein n=1 Tax=Penicillium canariense TaxID=189055 RepID=A0A9W9LI33_9EURO|nr:uncharacterized protein N7482_008149 [Penicillium canariense]KAJ5157049.1 hypothetical protein N7482_008149 [Penicillium canariense]